MKLKKVSSKIIIPSKPFDFDSTFHKPDHFTSGDNQWEKGIRWQTWHWQGKHLGLKFINRGTKTDPKVRVDIFFNKSLSKDFIDSLIEEIKFRFNLDLDLTDFYTQFKNDKVLKPIIKRWKGMRPGHPSSLYEYIIIGIVLQNATVRRSIQMFQALLKNYGKLLEYNGKELWCFWMPGGLKRVTEKQLRDLKVGYRAKSIKRIDDEFTKGSIDEFKLREKDMDTQKEELLKLYGVGPATVWYLLFDVFHHWGHFEHVSPWEQKIYSKVFFDRDPEKPVPVKKILKRFEDFGNYKHLAVHYIWEDLWWKRKTQSIPWLEKQIRI